MDVNTNFSVQALINTVAVMQESINQLTKQLNVSKRYELPGAPKMDLKDQKDPTVYSGQHFTTWSEDFITHLAMRDRRWDC